MSAPERENVEGKQFFPEAFAPSLEGCIRSTADIVQRQGDADTVAALWQRYREAGSPYGDTEEGMVRHVAEYARERITDHRIRLAGVQKGIAQALGMIPPSC